MDKQHEPFVILTKGTHILLLCMITTIPALIGFFFLFKLKQMVEIQALDHSRGQGNRLLKIIRINVQSLCNLNFTINYLIKFSSTWMVFVVSK